MKRILRKKFPKLASFFLAVFMGIGIVAGTSGKNDISEVKADNVTVDLIEKAKLSETKTLGETAFAITDTPISITATKGASNWPVLNYNSKSGTDLRFYKGTTGSVTFTADSTTISKIEFKKDKTTASTLGSAFSANCGTLTSNIWTGSSNSVTIKYNDTSNNYKEQIYIINVTYSGSSASTKTLESIAVSGTPTKTTYDAGEEFDPAGLVVTGTYDDKTTGTITKGIDWDIDPETLTAGLTSVSVTAKVGDIESDPFTVDGLTVNTPPVYEDKVLTFDFTNSIDKWPTTNSTTYTNYTYKLDDVDYTFGLKNVKCNSGYIMLTSTAVLGLPTIKDAKLKKVEIKNSSGCSTAVNVGISSSYSAESYISGGAKQTFSKQSSTYTYNLTDTSLETAYYVYVTNKNAQFTEIKLTYDEIQKVPTSIAAKFADDRVDYGLNDKIGEYTVTANYADGTQKDITSKVVVSDFDTTTLGNGKVATISYTVGTTTVSTTYTYNVIEDTLSYIFIDKTNSKVTGIVGQNYDASGVVVKGHFTSGDKVLDDATVTINPVAPTKRGTFDVTVTASYPEMTDAVETLEATAKNGGTKEYPFNATEAKEFIDAGKNLSNTYYVEGLVFSINKDKNYFYISDGVSEFEFYKPSLEGSTASVFADLQVGYYVVGSGALTKFSTSTYEFQNSCVVHLVCDPAKEPTKITIPTADHVYYTGDPFVMPTVTATLANGTDTENVTAKAEVDGFDNSTPVTDATATISYTYGRVTVTCDYVYTVKQDVLKSISIDAANSVVKGYAGPEELDGAGTGYFDFSGLKVYGNFDSNPNKDISSFVTVNCDAQITNAGTYNVTLSVTYGDMTSDPVTINGVIVENSGKSIDYPLTIARAKALADAGDTSNYYVTGYAKEDAVWDDSYKNGTVTLVDKSGIDFTLYRFKYDDSVKTTIEQADQVISLGKLTIYNGSYQLDSGNIVKKVWEPELTYVSIEMVVEPKLTYVLGETVFEDPTFVTEGMKIEGISDVGVRKDITSEVLVDTGDFDILTEGSYDITFTYGTLEPIVKTATVTKKVSYGTSYHKVTADKADWTGTYVIAYDTKLWNGTDSAANNCVDATVADGKISNLPDGAATVTVAKIENTDKYSVKVNTGTNKGKYMGNTGTSNGTSFSTTPIETSFAYSGGNVTITSKGGLNYQFNSNSDQLRFRFFKSTQKAVQLYEEITETKKEIQLRASYVGKVAEEKLTDRSKLTVADFKVEVRYDNDTWAQVTDGVTLEGTEVTLANGNNALTLKYKDFSATCNVTAHTFVPVTSITINEQNKSLYDGGETLQLTLAVLPDNTDNDSYTWTSSNEGLATVDENGLVTTADVVDGDNNTVTITATANDGSGVLGTTTITVNHDDLVSFTIISQVQHEYTDGDSLKYDGFDFTIRPVYESGREYEDVTYVGHESEFSFSRDELYSTVSNNTINVVVTYLGKNATMWVTVNPYVTGVSVKSVDGVDGLYSDHAESDGKVVATVHMSVTYSNGAIKDATEEIEITDFTAGSHTVNFTVGDKQTSFTYNVTEATVQSIAITKVGTTVFFDGEKFSLDGYEITATYNSGKTKVLDNSDITVVNGTKGLAFGDESVTIKYGNLSLTQAITVENETTVSAITVTEDSFTAILNEPFNFDGHVIGTYTTGDRDITSFVVSTINSTVDTSELGEKTYTITWNGVSFDITVNVVYADIENVKLVGVPKPDQYIGTEFDIGVVITPANANQAWTASSTDTSVATIDQNGHVVVVGEGSCYIVVNCNNGLYVFQINGVRHVESVSFEEDSVSLGLFEGKNTYDLSYTIFPENAYDPSVTFTVLDAQGNPSNGLIVTADGKVTAVYAGTYYVVVKTNDGSKMDMVMITVEGVDDVKSVTVSNYSDEFFVNEDYLFDGTIIAHYDCGDINITNQFKELIENYIDTSRVGEQTITISYGGKDIVITVTVQYASTTAINIENEAQEIYYVGDEFDLTYNVAPAAANQKVTWSSSNTSVAIVDENGHVRIVGVGDATITASQGAVTATYEIHAGKHVEGATFDQYYYTFTTEETGELKYSVNPGDAYDVSVKFTADSNYVQITEDGKITCSMPGTYEITLTSNDGKFVSYAIVNFVEVEADANGCAGSMVVASAIITLVSFAGVMLLEDKKRRNK